MLLHVQLDGVVRVVALAEFEEMVRAGTVGPETPVRTEAAAGPASPSPERWVPASNLSFYQALQASPDVMLRRAWALAGVPWCTAIVAGLAFRVFFWANGTPIIQPLVDLFARMTPAIYERDELWRLFTYGLLHGSAEHVGMNMLFIIVVGLAMERVIGSVNLAGVFVGSVFWGGVLSTLVGNAGTGAIGASAGDFGYLAGAGVFGLRYLHLLPSRARPFFGLVMVGYALYGLVNGIVGGESIDSWAHLGGLVAGGVQMALLRPNVGAEWRAHNRRVTGAAFGLVAAGVIGMYLVPIPLVPVEEDGLVAARPAWWDTGWSATGDRSWTSPLGGRHVVVRTVHEDIPLSLDQAVEDLVGRFRGTDAAVAVAGRASVERDGVPGARLTLSYAVDGVPHMAEAEVFTRGRYTHEIVVDLSASNRRVRALAPRILDSVKLPLPKEVAEALAPGEGWRAKMRRAEGAADIGDVATARSNLAAARQEAPKEPGPVQQALELEALYPSAGTPAAVEEALVAFPDNRRVLEAALHALVAAGQRQEALATLDARIAAAPDDRRLQKLRAELTEE